MATRYLRKDGTAASWAAATSDSSASTSASLSFHEANRGSLSPGDTVVVSGLGGIYRGTLTPADGIEYLFIDGGDISGADAVTSWVDPTAGESKVDSYETHTTTDLGTCFYNHSGDSASAEWVTATKDGNLSRVSVWLHRVGDVGSSEVWVELWSVDGSGEPVSLIAASSHLNTYSHLVEGAGSLVSFTFPTQPAFSNGVGYGFFLNSDLDSDWAGIYWHGGGADANFDAWQQTSGTWGESASESLYIEIYEASAGDGEVWYASQATDPGLVWMDGTLGTGVADVGSLAANGDYFWDDPTDRLYIYCDAGNPDTVYTTRGVEYMARSRAIIPTADDVTLDGALWDRCTYAGLFDADPGSGWTVQNCTGEWCRSAIETGAVAGTTPYSGWIIQDGEYRYCSVTGVAVNYMGTNIAVRRNWIHHVDHQDWYEASATQDYNAAIKFFDDQADMEDVHAYENLIHDIGNQRAGEYQGRGVGIWFDAVQPPTPTRCSAYSNYITDTYGNGVFVEIASYVDVYRNVVVDCGTAEPHTSSEYTPAGIALDCRQDDYDTTYNRVHHNVVVGGQVGIKLSSYDHGTAVISNNAVSNNAVSGASVHALLAIYGGDNVDYGSGNVYDYNSWGDEAVGFIRWGATSYDTYAAWHTASSQGAHDVTEAVTFTDAGSGDYSLAPGSAGLGVGEVLAAPFDEGLNRDSSWTARVLTAPWGAGGPSLGAYLEEASAPTGTGIFLRVDSAGKPIVYENDTARITGGNGDVSAGDDVQVILDGASVSLYVNGVQIGSTYTSLAVLLGTAWEMTSLGTDAAADAVELWKLNPTTPFSP